MIDFHSDKEYQLLVHIGFPKTATTWLQNSVFNNNDLGFLCPWGNRCGLAIDHFVNANPYVFNPKNVSEYFNFSTSNIQDKCYVISEETLLGDPAKGRYWGKIVADRLFDTFPKAKILICIREQKSYILSAYKEYVRNGGVYNLERYLGSNLNKAGFSGVFMKHFLEYDIVISYYQNLFGNSNVLILPFEMLETKPEEFISSLLQFTTEKKGAVNFEKVRSSLKGFTIEIRRCLNNYIPQPDWGVSTTPKLYKILDILCSLSDKYLSKQLHSRVDKRQREVIDSWINEYYRESNRKLSKLVSFDLSAYGYNI